ncbi:MAG: hypothetical protein N4P91_00260 [Candidatus Lightella neohaematopini]|nr:hypothetical protein [Candidatus Lightella neohaematopini]
MNFINKFKNKISLYWILMRIHQLTKLLPITMTNIMVIIVNKK